VFPEHDFRIFTVPAHGGPAFLKHHADLLAPEYWNAIKAELTSGTVPEFCPYPMEKRLRPTACPSDTSPARHVNDNLQPNT
jgi:isocitrate dehydrogenase kinase/phosphatase